MTKSEILPRKKDSAKIQSIGKTGINLEPPARVQCWPVAPLVRMAVRSAQISHSRLLSPERDLKGLLIQMSADSMRAKKKTRFYYHSVVLHFYWNRNLILYMYVLLLCTFIPVSGGTTAQHPIRTAHPSSYS